VSISKSELGEILHGWNIWPEMKLLHQRDLLDGFTLENLYNEIARGRGAC